MLVQEQPQEYQQDQNYLPFNYYQRSLADESLGSLQYQLDSDSIVEEIKHILKKEDAIENENGITQWKRDEYSIALINDHGLGNIIAVLKTRLTKIMILSDLEQSDISRILSDIHEDLTDDFYYNWEFYGIKDLATASLIISLVTDTVYATLRKGYSGNYMRLLRHTHNIQEIQQANLKRQGGDGSSASNRLMEFFKKRR
jgi:hypothetical protein